MLRFFRKHQGWMIKIAAFAVIAAMLPWGMWGTGGGDGPESETAGTILGEKVSVAELADLQKAAGAPPSAKPEDLEPVFWNLALARYGAHQGLTPDETFVQEYAKFITRMRREEPQDAQLALARSTAATSLFRGAMTASLSASDLECYEMYLEEDEERKIDFMRLAAKDLGFLADQVEISKAEIEKFYDTRKDRASAEGEPRLRRPAKVFLEYALAGRETIASRILVTDDEILAAYNADKDKRYRKEAADSPTPSTPVAAEPPAYTPLVEVRVAIEKELKDKKILEETDRLLKKAAVFTSEAASHPEDLASVAKRLGFAYCRSAGPFTHEELQNVPGAGDLQQAAPLLFREPIGKILQATTVAGGMLCKVLERFPEGAKPMAEVEEEIRRHLVALKVVEKAKEAAGEIVKLAENGSLALGASNLANRWTEAGLTQEPHTFTVETTEFFKKADASVNGVGVSAEFRHHAFDLARPKPDPKGAPPKTEYRVATDDASQTVFVLAVAQVRAPDPRGFASRKEALRRDLVQWKHRALLERQEIALRRDPKIAEFTYKK